MPRSELLALQELVRLGYYRGVMNQLESIAHTHPDCEAFVAAMDKLARQYQFETMLSQLQKALDVAPIH